MFIKCGSEDRKLTKFTSYKFMQIELIPGFYNPDIRDRLENLLYRCQSVKGTVAFWTLGIDFLNINPY